MGCPVIDGCNRGAILGRYQLGNIHGQLEKQETGNGNGNGNGKRERETKTGRGSRRLKGTHVVGIRL